MIDDDAGPKELGGEVTVQDKLNLLRLQIRQAQEAATKLPDLIARLRVECPHEQVIEWLGYSKHNRYRFCLYCGIKEKGLFSSTMAQCKFNGVLQDAEPRVVPLEQGESVAASPWADHRLPVAT